MRKLNVMLTPLVVMIILFAASINLAMAQPKSLELNGDYGCTSKEVQYMRVELLRRVLMTNDENTKQKMSEQIVQLSQKQCLPLNGKYRVISRTKDMAEVDVNNQRFWVLQ